MGNSKSKSNVIDLNENINFMQYLGPYNYKAIKDMKLTETNLDAFIDTLEKKGKTKVEKIKLNDINVLYIDHNKQLSKDLKRYIIAIKKMKESIQSKKTHLIKLLHSHDTKECFFLIFKIGEFPKLYTTLTVITFEEITH